MIVGSAIPLITATFATAPFVAHINMEIPGWARRSKDTLNQFVKKLPGDTRLEIGLLGFLPRPKKRIVTVSELRKLPPSWIRLANLEHFPKRNEGKDIPWRYKMFLKVFYAQFYVKPGMDGQKKSRAPGVWEEVQRHIRQVSETGSQATAKSAKPQRPARKYANR